MYRATMKHRFSKVDQENVAEKVHHWKASSPEDFFHFCPHGEAPSGEDDKEEDTQTLLFIHQTAWRRRLLERYGNDMCLLDATYKTTRYSLPLFFLVVHTNVHYQVVGLFVVQNETSHCIKDALQLLRKENPSWNPKNFMTDNCEKEITALEDIFPGTIEL